MIKFKKSCLLRLIPKKRDQHSTSEHIRLRSGVDGVFNVSL